MDCSQGHQKNETYSTEGITTRRFKPYKNLENKGMSSRQDNFITEKYEETHQIILCGDLNGTLLASRNNTHDDQRRRFASYYEDLSVPKEDKYDDCYLNLCKIRQQLYEKAMDKEIKDPEKFTEAEVMEAIGKLIL
ncbi:Hypothetical predicted protein [Mytilus galloprovincialis]|uniref:Uncharacterized protein n=1 Tax=Mytilus galloprovincialis TaxID=29158 RepID=A0A8B6G563_MYTGA|nr:Hypothetical predicted protein [Mytilus galloprovincialis]